MNIQELIKDPKVLGAIGVIAAALGFTFFGGSVSQEAQFNGDNNTQSADRNIEVNVDQSQENNQDQ